VPNHADSDSTGESPQFSDCAPATAIAGTPVRHLKLRSEFRIETLANSCPSSIPLSSAQGQTLNAAISLASAAPAVDSAKDCQ
jgi:hypothetical protein